MKRRKPPSNRPDDSANHPRDDGRGKQGKPDKPGKPDKDNTSDGKRGRVLGRAINAIRKKKSKPAERHVEHVTPLTKLPGRLALILLIAISIIRCVVGFSPDIYWDVLPGMDDMPVTMFGPLGTVLLDWLSVLVLFLALVDRELRKGHIHWLMVSLWLVGSLFAGWHGLFDEESLRIGASWIGGIALGVAAVHLGSEPAWRRLIIAAIVAMIIPLGVHAIWQVTVEHSMTVQDFHENIEERLAARGIEEGSIQHRKFAERLSHNEATGRFGLSNVFGSVMMTLTLIATAIAISVRKNPHCDKRLRLAVFAVTGLGLLAVFVTFSKGAIATLILTGIAIAAGLLIDKKWGRKTGVWRGIAFTFVAIGILVVLARASMGPPSSPAGERSLLFRWYYWQAAGTIWLSNPTTGIGPGEFKAEYSKVKNPLSPEDVADPHNVFVSFVSTLGIGGIAWSALLIMWLGRATLIASRIPNRLDSAAPEPFRWWVIGLAAVPAFFTQYLVQLPMLLIEVAVQWLVTSAGFIALAGLLSAPKLINRHWMSLGLTAAAMGVLLHSQIEMGLINVMACPILYIVLGLSAAAAEPHKFRHATWTWFTVSSVVLIAVGMLILHVYPIWNQQHYLASAANALRRGDIEVALHDLRVAGNQLPADTKTPVEEVRLMFHMVMSAHANNHKSTRDEYVDKMIKRIKQMRELPGNPTQWWRYEAAVSRLKWEWDRNDYWRNHAMLAAKKMRDYDPHGLSTHLEAADIVWVCAYSDEDRIVAYEDVLRIHEQRYLDPNAQLDEQALTLVESRLNELGAGQPRDGR